MSKVRLRRLTADYEKLCDYARRHPRVNIVQVDGDPPEKYQLQYQIKSFRQRGESVEVVREHLVEIVLPRNYPRTPPQCRMLTPVFHPNIAPHAICVGDHWSAGESLESIVIRIGEMLAYQSYNLKSPLNGEAAKWVESNEDRLPVDEVCMLPEDDDPEDEFDIFAPSSVADAAASQPEPVQPVSAVPPAPPSPPPLPEVPRPLPPVPPPVPRSQTTKLPELQVPVSMPAQPQPVQVNDTDSRVPCACPGCGKQYRVPAGYQGRWVRCNNCNTRFQFT